MQPKTQPAATLMFAPVGALKGREVRSERKTDRPGVPAS